MLAVPFAFIGFMLAELVGLPTPLWLPFTGVVAVASAVFLERFALGLAGAVGAFVAKLVMPSGDASPYQPTFSYQEALAARGDVDGALESYEALIAERPAEVEAYVQAAELCARSGRHDHAARLLRRLREVPDVPAARELYATQRLVDLYRGHLGDDGRALVELRRIVARFPATDQARAAREALGRLKAERFAAS